jgi:hypothetical protein
MGPKKWFFKARDGIFLLFADETELLLACFRLEIKLKLVVGGEGLRLPLGALVSMLLVFIVWIYRSG